MSPDPHFPIDRSDTAGLTAVLHRHAARSFRIAVALAGDSGPAVLNTVLTAAVRQAGRWPDEAGAARWFNHYTVLVARQFPPADPSPDKRFGRLFEALHALPRQQREAFILHHAERMDLRQTATAMDCSGSAAANHLVAATQLLRSVDPNDVSAFSDALPKLIAAPLPSPELAIDTAVRRAVRRRRLKRALRVGVVLSVIAVVAAAVWMLR